MAMDGVVRGRNTNVDSIGNLALLEPQLNAKLRNADFAERRAIYGQARFIETGHWLNATIE
jgi:hypothetical protein